MTHAPAHSPQDWWSADELAASGLPDLPTSKRAVNAMAARLEWRAAGRYARKRPGRGGGWEYHRDLFPQAAQDVLRQRAASVDEDAPARPDRGAAWATFERLGHGPQETAKRRLAALDKVDMLEAAGLSRDVAVNVAAQEAGVSKRSIWNWRALVDGVEREDRLAYLAPRHRIAARRVERAEYDPEWFRGLISDYLRRERPSFSSAYRRSVLEAKKHGWVYPPLRSARRLYGEKVQKTTETWKREGIAGLQRLYPPQNRDKTGLVPMQVTQADAHRFDLMVDWGDEIGRPQGVFFGDVYSGKILSVRVDKSPNKVAVMGAFRDMVRTYGLPQACLFDNGMEFANKTMTGGTPTRYRYKVRDDDHLGILPLLDIKVHWATPGHGQAKPIERSFRDMANDIARHPAFHGAWVGNKPDARPENWQERVIPIADFLEVLAEGIQEFNAREGRIGSVANGRSFDQVFDEAYRNAPIRKPTPEQMRMLLLNQETLTLAKGHGRLKFKDNYYYAEWMGRFAGQKVTARFDPDDLHSGLELYTADSVYLGFAPVQEAVGFVDMDGAKDHQRAIGKARRAQKRLDEALDLISAAELRKGGYGRGAAPTPKAPEATVRKVDFPENRPKPGRARPLPERTREQTAQIIALQEREAKAAKDPAPPQSIVPTDVRGRYQLAMDIEARSLAGQPIGTAEAKWWDRYRNTSEYASAKSLADTYGIDAI